MASELALESVSPLKVSADAETRARQFKQDGGKVIGYITPTAPVELIEAAGAYPLMLSAGEVTKTPLGDEYMEDLFDPAIRCIFERLLNGEYDFLDALVLPRGNDSAHRLYYYLSELDRVGAHKFPHLLVFDIAHSPDAEAQQFTRQKLHKLWGDLNELCGGNANDTNLSNAIQTANQRRQRLSDLANVRTENPNAIPGAQMLAIFTAARSYDHATFMDHSKYWLDQANSAAPATQGQRIVIAGSAQWDGALQSTLEKAGAQIVGDAHAIGDLSIGNPINETGDPMEALLSSYFDSTTSTRAMHDISEALLTFAKTKKADAVVFSYFAEEEALTWEYPGQRDALAKAGIASMRLPEQVHPFNADEVAPIVAEYLKNQKVGA